MERKTTFRQNYDGNQVQLVVSRRWGRPPAVSHEAREGDQGQRLFAALLLLRGAAQWLCSLDAVPCLPKNVKDITEQREWCWRRDRGNTSSIDLHSARQGNHSSLKNGDVSQWFELLKPGVLTVFRKVCLDLEDTECLNKRLQVQCLNHDETEAICIVVVE